MGLGPSVGDLDSVDLGWVAGILDGEGSVTFDRRGSWRRPGLSVVSTDKEILEKLQRILGGSIFSAKVERKDFPDGKFKPRWNWKLTGARQTIGVLRQVLPHMACPKKCARARHVIDNYERLTPLNGFAYSEAEKTEKLNFEQVFFEL